MTYASTTSVSVAKTKGALEKLLGQHGVTDFATYSSPALAGIGFKIIGRRVQFKLTLPDREDKQFTMTNHTYSKRRCDESIKKAWEQACRSKWRSLYLHVKSLLVAVEDDLYDLDTIFMAYMTLPGGQTVAERFCPEIDNILLGKDVPLLLELK